MFGMTFAKSVRAFSAEPIKEDSWTDIYLKYLELGFSDAYSKWMADRWIERQAKRSSEEKNIKGKNEMNKKYLLTYQDKTGIDFGVFDTEEAMRTFVKGYNVYVLDALFIKDSEHISIGQNV